MPEQTFEERLAQRLSTYAESGVRPFDPHAVARTTISSRARWGRLAWPMQWQGSTARSLRLALTISLMLALMLLAMLASGALLPGGTLPSSSGLFVWADGVATFIGQDGERATRSATSPRGDSCPVVVGSSGVVAQGGYGQIQLTDLVGELHALPIDTDYAGGERWSPDHRRIALFRFDGTVTVVSLVDPEAQQETTFDTPGVIDVAWAADGRHLAVARQVEGGDISGRGPDGGIGRIGREGAHLHARRRGSGVGSAAVSGPRRLTPPHRSARPRPEPFSGRCGHG